MPRLFGPFAAGLAVLALASASAHAADRVRLADGRHIALACRGAGGPTVVVDAGLGGSTTEGPWTTIADTLATEVRVCLYDRAGRGGSDPAVGVRSAAEVWADLDEALRVAGEPGPYVLAGHSVGGLHMWAYAGARPRKVAALVLVDSSHPDQDAAWLAALPSEATGEDAAVAATRAFLRGRMARPWDNPERLDVVLSGSQARAVRTLGDTPLVVLTHAPSWRMVPDIPEPVLAPLEAETQRLQRELLTLSRRSVQGISAAGGHDLPGEDPALVVAGIRAAVRAARDDVAPILCTAECDHQQTPPGDATVGSSLPPVSRCPAETGVGAGVVQASERPKGPLQSRVVSRGRAGEEGPAGPSVACDRRSSGRQA